MRFEVLTPATTDELVDILKNLHGKAQILAGGTDLFPKIKRGLTKPEKVLSLHKISSLRSLIYNPGNGLYIGALVTHAQVVAHPIIRQKFSALADACATVGSPQIRNLGTVAGNIANASPAADAAPALLALRAEVVIRTIGGQHSLPLADFFRGPGQTALGPEAVIEKIFVPEPPPGTLSAYMKLGRRKALEISICSVALAAEPADGRWFHVGLSLGAVAPVPLLDAATAGWMEGREWTPDLLKAAGQSAASAARPIDDQRASAAYRRSMIEVLVQRSAQQLSARIPGGAANA